jgi:hypothetical protein
MTSSYTRPTLERSNRGAAAFGEGAPTDSGIEGWRPIPTRCASEDLQVLPSPARRVGMANAVFSMLGPDARYALSMASTTRFAITRSAQSPLLRFLSFALLSLFAVRNDAIHREERQNAKKPTNPPRTHSPHAMPS